MQRMSIFVDGGNLFYCQRDVLGWWINWKTFLDFYRKSHTVVSAYYYRAFRVPPDASEKAFGVMLATNGYNLREKMLKQVPDKYTGQMSYKANLDIELAIDALTCANRYDICLLVSGDGDFVPLIRALTTLGKIVQVVSTPGSVAIEVRSEVGLDFQDLQDIRSQVENKNKPPLSRMPRNSTPPRAETAVIAPHASPGPLPVSPAPASVGDIFDAKIASIHKGGANLSNPWDMNVFLPISGLGVTGYIEDATTLLSSGDSVHVTVTDIDTSRDPWFVRVDLADKQAIEALQRKHDAGRIPIDQIPDSGAFEATVSMVKPYGAFLKNPWGAKALLHVSKLGLDCYVPDCTDLIERDDAFQVRIIKKEMRGNEVRLDIELDDAAYLELLRQRVSKAASAEEHE